MTTPEREYVDVLPLLEGLDLNYNIDKKDMVLDALFFLNVLDNETGRPYVAVVHTTNSSFVVLDGLARAYEDYREQTLVRRFQEDEDDE